MRHVLISHVLGKAPVDITFECFGIRFVCNRVRSYIYYPIKYRIAPPTQSLVATYLYKIFTRQTNNKGKITRKFPGLIMHDYTSMYPYPASH
jgi:hypothetical protein